MGEKKVSHHRLVKTSTVPSCQREVSCSMTTSRPKQVEWAGSKQMSVCLTQFWVLDPGSQEGNVIYWAKYWYVNIFSPTGISLDWPFECKQSHREKCCYINILPNWYLNCSSFIRVQVQTILMLGMPRVTACEPIYLFPACSAYLGSKITWHRVDERCI